MEAEVVQARVAQEAPGIDPEVSLEEQRQSNLGQQLGLEVVRVSEGTPGRQTARQGPYRIDRRQRLRRRSREVLRLGVAK